MMFFDVKQVRISYKRFLLGGTVTLITKDDKQAMRDSVYADKMSKFVDALFNLGYIIIEQVGYSIDDITFILEIRCGNKSDSRYAKALSDAISADHNRANSEAMKRERNQTMETEVFLCR